MWVNIPYSIVHGSYGYIIITIIIIIIMIIIICKNQM